MSETAFLINEMSRLTTILQRSYSKAKAAARTDFKKSHGKTWPYGSVLEWALRNEARHKGKKTRLSTCVRNERELVSARFHRFAVMPYGPIAQLDRASDYESEGRAFESLWVHHNIKRRPCKKGRRFCVGLIWVALSP